MYTGMRNMERKLPFKKNSQFDSRGARCAPSSLIPDLHESEQYTLKLPHRCRRSTMFFQQDGLLVNGIRNTLASFLKTILLRLAVEHVRPPILWVQDDRFYDYFPSFVVARHGYLPISSGQRERYVAVIGPLPVSIFTVIKFIPAPQFQGDGETLFSTQ
ncbi:hypothetical protein M422DRAFT_251590 [Sphaerobolus stellatus SS14]|uniref:Uncharacterized protein n=1 Tax=Sphaerobolus stellatus (strain SS14) TaxID=990650 RepID=A0A0C9UQ06_SPHS4|nr:hypothetical protein M422DRAFT_251590 [Sphaerobolus stellatus SS14]